MRIRLWQWSFVTIIINTNDADQGSSVVGFAGSGKGNVCRLYNASDIWQNDNILKIECPKNLS